jgi:hypothetical protein
MLGLTGRQGDGSRCHGGRHRVVPLVLARPTRFVPMIVAFAGPLRAVVGCHDVNGCSMCSRLACPTFTA